MAIDKFRNTGNVLSDPFIKSETAIVNTEFVNGVSKALILENSGSIEVEYNDGTTQVFPNVNSGFMFPCRCKKIISTTAGIVIAVY